jgi:tetratricopeptide (TPR) repeat protein
MEQDNSNSTFWPSYVDIMTSLFAIMLVLFIVSYSRFKIKEKELEEFVGKYKEIVSIYQAVDNIDPTYFEFNEQYLKHIFKIQVNYQKGEFALDKLIQDAPTIGGRANADYNRAAADSIRRQIIEAGREIRHTILNLQRNDSIRSDIKYLVVLEGQASSDGYHINDYYNNDVLSYQRALKLHEFWRREAGIDFTKMDKCELVIAGSGEGGVPRARRFSPTDDSHNQRFLIHIVPVIGNIHLKDK